MIGKITKGSDPAGLIAYVTATQDHEGREREQVTALGGTVLGRDARELAAGFEALAALRPGLDKSTAHLMLRWTDQDHPSIEDQAQMAALHAEALGYAHWSAWSHGDHIHIAASRVQADGTVVSDSWDWRRAEVSVRELERRFGLVQVDPSHLLDPNRRDLHRAAPTADELGAAGRGEPSIRLQLQQAVDAALQGDGDVDFGTFVERLHSVGIQLRPNLQSTGRVAGIALRLDGIEMKASRLGKAYSWAALQRRGLSYEQSRDDAVARACIERIAGAGDRRSDGPSEGGGGGDRRDARAGSEAPGPAGRGRGVADGRGAVHADGTVPVDAEGASSEPSERQDDSRGSGSDSTEAGRSPAEAGKGHQDLGGDRATGGGREPAEPQEDGDHGRAGGQPAAARSGSGAGVADGASVAGPDFEVLDGTEDGLAALRKWARNARRALAAQDAAAKVGKKLPRLAPVAMPALFRLSALARVPASGRDLTLEQVHRQIEALGCEMYEIGVLPPRHRKDVKPERTRKWAPEQVEKAVPWLRRMNALDRDIYVRPAPLEDGRLPPLVFVDDLDAATVEAMARDGLPLAVHVESSPGSHHGWVRVADVPLTRDEANAVARELAARYQGDRGAAAWNQFGRAAGFTNRKRERRTERGAPFARLRGTTKGIAPAGAQLLEEVRAELRRQERQEHAKRARASARQAAVAELGAVSLASAAEAFRKVRERIGTTKAVGTPDESARDYGAVRELIREGWEDEHVLAALLEVSPDLYDRHRDPAGYAARTVAKARRGLPSQRRATAGLRPRGRT